jgi:hypothetical protein
LIRAVGRTFPSTVAPRLVMPAHAGSMMTNGTLVNTLPKPVMISNSSPLICGSVTRHGAVLLALLALLSAPVLGGAHEPAPPRPDQRTIRVEIEMNNSAGVFQVDELLATKLRGTPLEDQVEVLAPSGAKYYEILSVTYG